MMKKNGKKVKKKKTKSSKPAQWPPINVNTAGIDIGSKSHHVSVPEDRDNNPVREFNCFTPDLHKMAQWLKECGIDRVVMESTGVYWIPVIQILEQYEFETKLVDARHAKNVTGRKSDVQDCQWLRELDTFGLLASAFRPDDEICVLRSYWRHRAGLVEEASKQIQLMQKSLIQMNLQLHKVITDITGATGMSIIRAIVAGERDPKVLAKMRDHRIKSSEASIAAALSGDYRSEHLFVLTQSLDLYDYYQRKIEECDQEIASYVEKFESQADPADIEEAPQKMKKKKRKNEPQFDLREELFRIAGVDLTQIPGIDAMTALTIISECGHDMSPFPSSKAFCSWLGLCPNNKITGGSIKSSRTRNVNNRIADALRLSAQSLHRSDSALGGFYRRMRSRLAAPEAITAVAHKLARIVYSMLKYGKEYVERGMNYYETHYKQRVLRNLKKRAKSLGFDLVNPQTGEVITA